MFKGLHQKYFKKKKTPPPKPQIAIGKQQLLLLKPLSVIHALKKNPCVEFGGLLICYRTLCFSKVFFLI